MTFICKEKTMKKFLSLFLTIILTLTLAMPLTVSAATKPAKPKISSVSAISSTSIKIKWKKVSSADGYEIFQKSGSGSYKKVKTITSAKTTAYTKKSLSSAKKYTYKIRAFDKVGSKKVYGAYSTTKSTYTKFKTTKITSLDANSNSIKLKWKKISDADGYEIYQKVSGGSYKKIKTITSGKTTSYTNKKLSPSKKYSYKIKVYKKSGSKKIYGDYSAVKSIKTKAVVWKADNNKYFLTTITTPSKKELKACEDNYNASPTKLLDVDYLSFSDKKTGGIGKFGTYLNDKGDLQSKALNYKGDKYYADWGGAGDDFTYEFKSPDTLTLTFWNGNKTKLKIVSEDAIEVVSSSHDWFEKGDVFSFDKELNDFFSPF